MPKNLFSFSLDSLKKLEFEALYVLDSSAILSDPYIERYITNYEGLKQPAVFILTAPILKEVDDSAHNKVFPNTAKRNHGKFLEILRDLTNKGKLSDGVSFDSGDKIIFIKENLRQGYINDLEFNFLGESVDRQLLLMTAALLKEYPTKTIALLTADGLIKVLCKEAGIDSIYIKEELNEENKNLPNTTATQEYNFIPENTSKEKEAEVITFPKNISSEQ